MAQLPVYHSQGAITTDTPNNIRELDAYAQGAKLMAKAGNTLSQLSQQWQDSKDEVENLDAKNKLNSGIASILEEANNYNEYTSPADLQAKQNELTQRMNGLTNDIMGGFSNNRKAREFESNANFAIQQNNIRLQGLFREKYGDLYNSNLEISANEALKNFTLTGNEAFKNQYYDAIDTGVKAGYLDHGTATKLKLSTDDWNYDYVYSKLIENPYFKAPKEVMAKIPPAKQRTLQNFQRSQIKMAHADALNNALNTYYLNPTQENLNNVYKLNPKLKGSKKLEDILIAPANFEQLTNFEGYSEALKVVRDLANTPNESYEQKQEFMKKAGEIAYKIRLSNETLNDNDKPIINDKEQALLFDVLYKKMNDKTFKNSLRNLPDLSNLKEIELRNKMSDFQFNAINFEGTPEEFLKEDMENQKEFTTYAGENSLWKEIGRAFNLQKIKDETASNVLKYASVGKIKEAQEEYEKGLHEAIKAKYWYIPELQKENLQIGQKFTVNGKVYSFQGYSDKDIIVEVN